MGNVSQFPSPPVMLAGSRELHTIGETAGVLRCSERTVHRLIAAGALRTVRVGRRRLVPAAALVDYLDQRGG